MSRTLLTTVAVLGLVCLSIGSTAQAQVSSEVSERVSYADLNLAKEAGARALLRRIDHAARRVCGDRSGRAPFSEQARIRVCIGEASGRAVAALDHPVVTAVYEGRQIGTVVAAARDGAAFIEVANPQR